MGMGMDVGPGPAPGDSPAWAARWGVPLPAGYHVPRPRLDPLLDAADRAAVVVVSAPAGTGKTTAVADWVRGKDPARVGWITFEDTDTEFWPHALEALRRLGIPVPPGWRVLVGGGLDQDTLGAVTIAVAAQDTRVTLVLDGFEVASQSVGRDLDYLVRHSGGRLQLVLVSRVDPLLPLYRYRLNATMVEVRAPDLAFTDDEAAVLLGMCGAELDERTVHDLNRRLRGWAAGLRFAGRALAEREDPAAYAATVVEHSGDINEYLVHEVLDGQAPEVRRFLLDTSVADVVSAELAEMLGGPSAVRTMYDLMSRRAFVEPVPGQPGSFRYHPFFRALLRAHLTYESPERARRLTSAVSQWLREQGFALESLETLARVGAWAELADEIVLEELVGTLLLEDEDGALRRLAHRAPADLHTPAAALTRAAVAAAQGETERCDRELATASSESSSALGPAYDLAVTVVSAYGHCLTGDTETAGRLAQRARGLVGEPRDVEGAPALSELARVVEYSCGVAALRSGRLEEAEEAFTRAVEHAPPAVSTAFRAECWGRLALVEVLQGQLSGAVRCAEESLAKLAQPGASRVRRPPVAHVALALVGVARCDPDLAWVHLRLARSNPRLVDDRMCQALVEVATATLEHDDGSHRTARDRLETAALAAMESDAWTADRLWVAAARMAAREGDRERAAVTLARLSEPGRPDALLAATLAGVDLEAHAEGRDASRDVYLQVAVLILAAITGPESARATALGEALRVAAPERLRRPFRDGGPSLTRLLTQHAPLLAEHAWVSIGPGPVATAVASHTGEGSVRPLIEPLTAKELEVLGHLAELLTTEEIAQKMFVSVNTVRTHIRHILRKLGVNRRNAAIRQARELGLIAA